MSGIEWDGTAFVSFLSCSIEYSTCVLFVALDRECFYLVPTTYFYDDSALLHLVLHLPFVLIVAILLSLSVERPLAYLYVCRDLKICFFVIVSDFYHFCL